MKRRGRWRLDKVDVLSLSTMSSGVDAESCLAPWKTLEGNGGLDAAHTENRMANLPETAKMRGVVQEP